MRAIRSSQSRWRPHIVWDRLHAPTAERLQSQVELGRYDILHFSGHGIAAGEGRQFLAHSEERQVLGRRSFDHILAGARHLKLVVLNLCQSADAISDGGFEGLAEALIERGVPAVLAMRGKVHDVAAIQFSRWFYYSLESGVAHGNLHVALTVARSRLHLLEAERLPVEHQLVEPLGVQQAARPLSRLCFGSPVLYLAKPERLPILGHVSLLSRLRDRFRNESVATAKTLLRGTLLVLVIFFLRWTGAFEPFSIVRHDLWMHWVLTPLDDPEVCMVELDPRPFVEWRWCSAELIRLLKMLRDDGAKVIAIDNLISGSTHQTRCRESDQTGLESLNSWHADQGASGGHASKIVLIRTGTLDGAEFKPLSRIISGHAGTGGPMKLMDDVCPPSQLQQWPVGHATLLSSYYTVDDKELPPRWIPLMVMADACNSDSPAFTDGEQKKTSPIALPALPLAMLIAAGKANLDDVLNVPMFDGAPIRAGGQFLVKVPLPRRQDDRVVRGSTFLDEKARAHLPPHCSLVLMGTYDRGRTTDSSELPWPDASGERRQPRLSILASVLEALLNNRLVYRGNLMHEMTLQTLALGYMLLVRSCVRRAKWQIVSIVGIMLLIMGFEVALLSTYNRWLDGPVLELAVGTLALALLAIVKRRKNSARAGV